MRVQLVFAGAFLVSALVYTPLGCGATSASSTGESSFPDLDCVIQPSAVAQVGSAVPGLLQAVHVDRSDLVDQGAVIAELDSGVEKAAVEFARLRSKLTAEIELRRASAAFGQRQQTRNRELFHKHAISAQDMDQLETETRLAHLQLRQAEDNQQLAALELRQAEEALKRRTIRSPVKGVVVERFKAVGEYVEDTPVLHIAQLDPLHVEVIAPVDLIGRIRNGMQAEVTPESPTTSSHHATVTRVDRVADPSSATFGIRLELPNTDYRIPAGLRCRLRFLPEVTGNPGQLAGTTSEPEETVPKAAATTAARETAPAIDQATAAPKQVASTTPNHAARSEP